LRAPSVVTTVDGNGSILLSKDDGITSWHSVEGLSTPAGYVRITPE
jgi:hypothetical protein